ncbi:MAG: tRNA epoxyqueuosine(34) reductase QueG [Candidatus Zixiibacteriota bacterium]
MMDQSSRQGAKARLLAAAAELGFDAVGLAAVEVENDDRDRLFSWLTRGYHGGLTWMARHADRRADVTKVLPRARTVISLAVNYYTPVAGNDCCRSLKVSRYAWGEDYHRVLERKLDALLERLRTWLPGEQFLSYCDTGPVMEKAWAQRAGLGWIGKNACLITRGMGSWVFLAEIITTAELPPDAPHSDFCGSCTHCLDACPTDAITEPYVVDTNRCIAYWTIESHDDIPAEIAERSDGWIFGCDICQDVCPWNKFGRPTSERAFLPRADCLCPPREHWVSLSEDEFGREFRHSAIARTRASGLARNIQAQFHDPLRRVVASLEWKPPDTADDITVPGVDTTGGVAKG